VEDLVQEVFIKAFEALPRFERRSGFATWMYRITVNLCVEAARKESSQRRTLRQAFDSEALPDSVLIRDPEGGPRLVMDRELQMDVRRALAELEPETRALLTLRYLEEFTTVEMAEVLEWPEGTVRSKLHAARKELALMLKPFQEVLEGSQRKRGK
jgi:RNA polymerase sigma-70 factor (ECF subfamily)